MFKRFFTVSSKDDIRGSVSWRPHGVHKSADPYLYALGALHKAWLDVERAYEFLLWHYLNADRDRGEAISTHVGNTTRSDIMLSLAEILEPDATVLEAVKLAKKCYDTLRINRNLLAHSQMGGVDKDGITTFRITARGVVKRETLKIPLAFIHDCAEQSRLFQIYLFGLRNHIQRGAALPDRFPQPPDLLTLIRKDQDQ